jgi:hypothetical protein
MWGVDLPRNLVYHILRKKRRTLPRKEQRTERVDQIEMEDDSMVENGTPEASSALLLMVR